MNVRGTAMKHNRPPAHEPPAVFKGFFSVSPKWTDVLFADLLIVLRTLMGK